MIPWATRIDADESIPRRREKSKINERNGSQLKEREMRKRGLSFITTILTLFLFASQCVAETPAPPDKRKHTASGKYVTARQAYEMWKADPGRIKILDCRTREEYLSLGHPTMAYSIPAHLRTRGGTLQDNPELEARARQRFKPEDVILVICRAGYRSAEAVNRLSKSGFRYVYNVFDGFEGDGNHDTVRSADGMRTASGWKNSGAPWTYKVDPNLL
jgi:rhodanese-related sulfurtransferase